MKQANTPIMDAILQWIANQSLGDILIYQSTT